MDNIPYVCNIINKNTPMGSIPIFSSIFTDPYSTDTDLVYVECLPLVKSLYYENIQNTDPTKTMIELHAVKNNFLRVFKSMEYAIHLNAFNFSLEFANMVSSSFLEMLFRPILEKGIHINISNEDVLTLYRVLNFIEFNGFEFINRDFIFNVKNRLFSDSILEDTALIFQERILSLYNPSNFKSVLYPDDWGKFEKTIRDNISKTYGIYYSTL